MAALDDLISQIPDESLRERIRAEMKREGVDIYIVPSTDYHHSEYVGEYFKARQFMTGFTGSAGTAVFTKDKACLWTDGRYFIQAEEQLKEWIEDCSNIVFSAEPAYPQKAGFRISAVWTGCITRNTSIRRR